MSPFIEELKRAISIELAIKWLQILSLSDNEKLPLNDKIRYYLVTRPIFLFYLEFLLSFHVESFLFFRLVINSKFACTIVSFGFHREVDELKRRRERYRAPGTTKKDPSFVTLRTRLPFVSFARDIEKKRKS